jgi:hypothetical protein
LLAIALRCSRVKAANPRGFDFFFISVLQEKRKSALASAPPSVLSSLASKPFQELL